MIRGKKKTGLKEKKLEDAFSKFIRVRDAQPFTGICFCFTCGAPRHWKGLDCGHGINRQYKGTKYDERNNHAQCKHCNGFHGGMRDVYKVKVDEKYGAGTWDELTVKARATVKWAQFEIDIMAKHYEDLANKIILEKKI